LGKSFLFLYLSDIRTGMTYPNVATEFISNIRTGTTYPNVAPEFISDIRTGTTYPNVAPESNIRDELSC
jgi:hypothetical protein